MRARKGQAIITELPMVLLFIIALGISIIVVTNIAVYFTNNTVEIGQGVEEFTLSSLFSNNCFAYVNEVGRVEQNSIDYLLLTEEKFASCLKNKDIKYAFSITLAASGIENQQKIIKSKNWAEQMPKQEFAKDVYVIYSGKRLRGTLTIGVQDA